MLEQLIESKISRQQLVVHGLRLPADSFSVPRIQPCLILSRLPEGVPRQRPN